MHSWPHKHFKPNRLRAAGEQHRIVWDTESRLLLLIHARDVEHDIRTARHRLLGATREEKWREVVKRIPFVFDSRFDYVDDGKRWTRCYSQFKDLERRLYKFKGEHDSIMTKDVFRKLLEYMAVQRSPRSKRRKDNPADRPRCPSPPRQRAADEERMIRDCEKRLEERSKEITVLPPAKFRWTEVGRLLVIRTAKLFGNDLTRRVSGNANWIQVAKRLPTSVFRNIEVRHLARISRKQFTYLLARYRIMKTHGREVAKTRILTRNICRELEDFEENLRLQGYLNGDSAFSLGGTGGSDCTEADCSSASDVGASPSSEGFDDSGSDGTVHRRDDPSTDDSKYVHENRTSRERAASRSCLERRGSASRFKHGTGRDEGSFEKDDDGLDRELPSKDCDSQTITILRRRFDNEFSHLSKWFKGELLQKERVNAARAISSHVSKRNVKSKGGCLDRSTRKCLKKMEQTIKAEFHKIRQQISEDLEKAVQCI